MLSAVRPRLGAERTKTKTQTLSSGQVPVSLLGCTEKGNKVSPLLRLRRILLLSTCTLVFWSLAQTQGGSALIYPEAVWNSKTMKWVETGRMVVRCDFRCWVGF